MQPGWPPDVLPPSVWSPDLHEDMEVAMRTMWKQARNLAEATPPERDRYIDFLRLFSIAIVVIGHWLMAVIVVRDGDLVVDHLLVAEPRIQYSTWILQVMPIFFIVGGFANSVSWAASRERGSSYSSWLQARTARLLRPTAVFAAVWAAAALVLNGTGIDRELLRPGTQVVAGPLWFLAVYMGVVALAPLMVGLDRRFGWAIPIGLLGAAGIVDWLHHGLGVPVVGWVNFLFVWLGIHQLGVRWQRGAVRGGRIGASVVALVGLAALLALTVSGRYPVSMVGVPGAEPTNNLPPTVALMMLAVFQMGLILALRSAVARWLERPTVWSAVILGNGRIMTIYLWHMTAMVAVISLGLLLGGVGLGIEPLSGGWWWSRPVWFGVLLLPLAGLIALFGRQEQNRTSRPVAKLAVGVGFPTVMWGFSSLALNGFVTAGAVALMPAAAVTVGSWTLGVRLWARRS